MCVIYIKGLAIILSQKHTNDIGYFRRTFNSIIDFSISLKSPSKAKFVNLTFGITSMSQFVHEFALQKKKMRKLSKE